MTRFLLTALACVATPFAGLAQPVPPPKVPLPTPKVGPVELERTLRLVGPSVPILKDSLLPLGRDRTSGNAALGYLRAATLTPEPPRDPAAAKKLRERVEAWLTLPDDQPPPAGELAEYLRPYRPMFRTLDEAARMTTCDWQDRAAGGSEEVAVALNLVQSQRAAARLLKLRVQLELAGGRTADALRTLQTALQHPRHVGEAGSLIDLLVAHALVNIALTQAEQLTTRPGAPNLYWALATLPHPLIDPRPSLDGELRRTMAFLPQLAAMEAGSVTEAVASKAFTDHLRLLGGAGLSAPNGLEQTLYQVAQTVGLAALAPAARDELATRGWARADLDKMPAAQAMLVRSASLYRELWDDHVALFFLPGPQAAAGRQAAMVKSVRVTEGHANDLTLKVFSLILPSAGKVHEAHTRTERRVALFCACEAVRLHAATHDGKLPATLADVSVFVPNDPVTAKPFGYGVTATGYRLDALPPAGKAGDMLNAITLSVTVQR